MKGECSFLERMLNRQTAFTNVQIMFIKRTPMHSVNVYIVTKTNYTTENAYLIG